MSALPPILLLDDDPDDLFILRRLLAKAGAQNKIETFEDARAACVHLEGVLRQGEPLYQPCIVFTDLQMPGMGGFEFARWIRQHSRFASTLIVMVTSSEDPGNPAAAIAAGVDKLIAKYPTVAAMRAILATWSPGPVVLLPPAAPD